MHNWKNWISFNIFLNFWPHTKSANNRTEFIWQCTRSCSCSCSHGIYHQPPFVGYTHETAFLFLFWFRFWFWLWLIVIHNLWMNRWKSLNLLKTFCVWATGAWKIQLSINLCIWCVAWALICFSNSRKCSRQLEFREMFNVQFATFESGSNWIVSYSHWC